MVKLGGTMGKPKASKLSPDTRELAAALVAAAQNGNVRLYAKNNKLLFMGGFKLLRDELKADIISNKQDIIIYLLETEGPKELTQPSLYENFTDEDMESFEGSQSNEAEEDLGRKQPKKKSKESMTIFHTLTKTETENLERLYNSRRLYRRLETQEGVKYCKDEHYLVRDRLKAAKGGQFEITHQESAQRILQILAQYSDCKYLNLIDRVWEDGTKKLQWPAIPTPGSYHRTVTEIIKNNFPELQIVVGAAIFWRTPIKNFQGEIIERQVKEPFAETREHFWFVDSEGLVVDPLWKFFPDTITCYSENIER